MIDKEVYDVTAFLDFIRRKFFEKGSKNFYDLRSYVHKKRFHNLRYKVYKEDILLFMVTKEYRINFLMWLDSNEKYFKF